MKKRNFDPSSGLLEMHFSMHEVEVCNHVIKNSHWLIIIEYSRASHNAAFSATKDTELCKSALFKVQCFSDVQVILSALIQVFSTVQFILSALIQDFSAVQVFFINANPRFCIEQDLFSGTFGHQR